MIKIMTIIGARPQFIKAAMLSRAIRSSKWLSFFNEVIVHTGQHYDHNMSTIFFNDLNIPLPDYNLNIGGNTHAQMTGQMLIELENKINSIKPKYVLVYGDTNSTLAGSLVASKMNIDIIHIEAGLRSFNKRMPEEQNRIITDHLSTFLFCPTKTAIDNLYKEGITKGVYNVGDIMLDATLYYKNVIDNELNIGVDRVAKISGINKKFINKPFILLTLHRAENTDNKNRITNIINALNKIKTNIIFPLHPRTAKMLREYGLTLGDHINVIEPVGYLEMMALELKCMCVFTDSGGVQKEAYFLKKPCITLRDETEWVETLTNNCNQLVGSNTENILSAFNKVVAEFKFTSSFGDGNTSDMILQKISNYSAN